APRDIDRPTERKSAASGCGARQDRARGGAGPVTAAANGRSRAIGTRGASRGLARAASNANERENLTTTLRTNEGKTITAAAVMAVRVRRTACILTSDSERNDRRFRLTLAES